MGGQYQVSGTFRRVEYWVDDGPSYFKLAHVSNFNAPAIGVEMLVYGSGVLQEGEVAYR